MRLATNDRSKNRCLSAALTCNAISANVIQTSNHATAPYFLTTHDACLLRSLCLVRYLARVGIGCDFVFGVQTSPFAAHCWVEHDGVVLNDHLDNTLNYTKILSV